MKEESKVIMGATLLMVTSIAIVLGLVLVLLAELYCSLLLQRRRHLRLSTLSTFPEAPVPQPQDPRAVPSPPSLSSFISQGVLDAPRSFLFPELPNKEERPQHRRQHLYDIEKQWQWQWRGFHHFLNVECSPGSSSCPSSPSTSYLPWGKMVVSGIKPSPITAAPEAEGDLVIDGGGACHVLYNGVKEKQLVYISNPMYDVSDPVGPSMRMDGTPFETPDTSPSRLETDEQEMVDEESSSIAGSKSAAVIWSPPLTPIKEQPAKACPVALREASFLSNSHDVASSSSTSGTPPCTWSSW